MNLDTTSLKQCFQGNKNCDFLPILKGVYYFIVNSYLTSLIHVKNSIIAYICLAVFMPNGIQHAWLPW